MLRIGVSVLRKRSDREHLLSLQTLLGVLLTKTGPMHLTVDDLLVYQQAALVPHCDVVNDGISVYLLGEDEINNANFSGRG